MFSRIWTLTKIEFYKLFRQKIFYLSFTLIIVVVVLSVMMPKFTNDSKNPVNGFGPLINACLNGFRITSFLVLILSALLFASETTFNTLKTILVAPFRRTELILAKALTIIILVVVFSLLIESISFGLSWLLYGFADITDPAITSILQLAKSKMYLCLLYTFILTILPLITAGLMGLFISTLVENAGIAIALCVISYLILDTFVEGLFENVSSFLFNHYLNYYLTTCKDITDGITTEIWKFQAISRFFGYQLEDVHLEAERVMEVVKSILVPVGSSIIFLILSIVAVNKKRAQ